MSQEWRLQAACRGNPDPRAFGRADEQEEFIAEFCRRCPVQVECGQFGASQNLFGVYGGMTARQRRARMKASA